MLVVLDTTVLIDFLRGKPAAERVRSIGDRGDVAATTAINVEELVRGFRGNDEAAARRLVDALVLLPLDATVGWMAGEWRRDFAARGITLSQADCLIAAATVRNGGRLATANVRDFPMEELDLEPWTA